MVLTESDVPSSSAAAVKDRTSGGAPDNQHDPHHHAGPEHHPQQHTHQQQHQQQFPSVHSMGQQSSLGGGGGLPQVQNGSIATVVTGGSISGPGANTKNAQLRRLLEEKETIIVKQKAVIDSLEKSIATQRSRYLHETAECRAQTEQAVDNAKRLEMELDKRERFGRNQVHLLFC